MAIAEEIQVLLTAQTAQLKAGMDEAAAVVRSTQDEMAASMATSMNAFREFDAIQKGSIQTAQQLSAAQEAVTAAQASGAFTAEEIAEKQALVAAAMQKVGTETKAASGVMAAFAHNSRTAYTTSALISDAMTGQFSRSRREVAAFANETGLMSRALRAAFSPAGLLAGVVGVLGLATVKAEEDLNDFNDVVERTNGYMGTSAGELQAAAQKIESLGVSYSDAKQAVIDLASSGRFTGEQLLQAATSAAEFAQLTGEKVGQVDKLMVEMATNPQKALDELVEKYHRVTPAQAEVIEGLIKQGDKAAATAALVHAMGTSVAESFDKQSEHAGKLDKIITQLGRDFDEVWRGIGESLNVATGGGDAAEKLTLLQHQLADMRASGETTGGYAVAYQALEKQAQELQTIIGKQHQSAAAAKQMADAYAQAHPAQGTFAAFQKNGLDAIDINGNLTKQLQTAEAAMKTSYGNREQLEEEYWGTVLQKAQRGSAAYIQAWQRVQSLQQQLDERQSHESQEAARKQTEASRKAAEEARQQHEKDAQSALRSLEEKRDATVAFSRERMQLDAEIVAAAIKWYGQDSNAYRQAERQKIADAQADAKELARQHKEAAVTDAETAREIANARIANDKQQAQTEYDQGKITAGQLLQIQDDLVQQKLAADLAYLKAKQTLDAGDVNAEKQDAAQIAVAKLKASQQMSADLDKSLKQDEAKWKQYSQRIAGAMQNAVNAMLFQHQTLRNSLASIGESIAETFIEAVVDKPVQKFIAGEGEKLAAAIGFGAQKNVADQAQRAINASADATDKAAAAARSVGLAGANAIASFAGAPWPIDMGAPAFAAAMMAEAASFGTMASAAGGWERVPADGMMAQLHKDEMVLPKRIADPMRDMVRNGGAGGGTHHHHYTIKAYDRRGLADFVARNGIELGKGLQRLGRNGHTL